MIPNWAITFHEKHHQLYHSICCCHARINIFYNHFHLTNCKLSIKNVHSSSNSNNLYWSASSPSLRSSTLFRCWNNNILMFDGWLSVSCALCWGVRVWLTADVHRRVPLLAQDGLQLRFDRKPLGVTPIFGSALFGRFSFLSFKI